MLTFEHRGELRSQNFGNECNGSRRSSCKGLLITGYILAILTLLGTARTFALRNTALDSSLILCSASFHHAARLGDVWEDQRGCYRYILL